MDGLCPSLHLSLPSGCVVQGLLLSVVDKFPSAMQFIRLWRNECLRVFHDRLICVEDKELVQTKIKDIVSANYGGMADHIMSNPILFGDYRLAMKVMHPLNTPCLG